MITILSIIVPVIIFLIVLWTVALIQKHWIDSEREIPGRTGAKKRAGHSSEQRVCEECGTSGPDVLFVNRLCLNCYEEHRKSKQSEDYSREQYQFSGEMAGYYRLLGCSERDSDREVKRRYHRKAKEVHPDSFQGQDLPEDVIKLRSAEFQELHEAYTRILEHRARRD